MATKKKKKVVKHVKKGAKKKPRAKPAKKRVKQRKPSKKAAKRRPKPSRKEPKSGSKGKRVSKQGRKRTKPVVSSRKDAKRIRGRKPAAKPAKKPAKKGTGKGRKRVAKRPRYDSGRERKRDKEVKPKKKPAPKPKKKPAPKPKKKVRERVEVTSLYAGGFTRDRGVAQTYGDYFTLSSKGNNGDPSDIRVDRAFNSAFASNLAKGPFEAKDVVIYNHGIHLRPKDGNIGVGVVREIESIVKSFGIDAKITVIEETPTVDSIRIVAVNTEGIDVGATTKNLSSLGAMWTEIFNYMEGEFEDVNWFVVWDVEEAMY
jgi:hypothetical protein